MIKIVISSNISKLENLMYDDIQKNDINSNNILMNNSGEKFILSPEFKTNYYEKRMAEKYNGVNVEVDVLSFARLPYMLFKNTKYNKNIYVDKIVRDIYLKQILKETDLKLLNSDKYLEEISKIITKLKENEITPEKLKEIFLKDVDEEFLTLFETKIYDIAKILEKYNEKNINAIDKEEIYFQILKSPEVLECFRNSKIHVLGFVGFSKIQMQLLVEIAKYTEEMIIYLPIDNERLDFNNSNEDADVNANANSEKETDLQTLFNETYMYSKMVYKRLFNSLIQIPELRENIRVVNIDKDSDKKNKSININKNKNINNKKINNLYKIQKLLSKYGIYEYITDKDLKLLKEEAQKENTIKENDDSLNILKFQTIDEEIRYVAEDINNKILSGETRDDFQIVVLDLDTYKSKLIKEFNKRKLILNVSKKENIYKGELIRIIDYLICSLNLDVFQIVSLLKTKMFTKDIFNKINIDICEGEGKENEKEDQKEEKINKDTEKLEEIESNSGKENDIYIYLFERYIQNWKVSKYNVQKHFKFGNSTYAFEEIEKIRKYMILEILNIYKEIFEINDEELEKKDVLELKEIKTNGKNISKAIYNFLEKHNIFDRLYEKYSEKEEMLSKYKMQINILNNILDKLSIIEDITVSEYISYFKMIIQNYDIHIFENIHGLNVTTPDKISISKNIYVLGANEYNFPKHISSNSILSEDDNLKFKEMAIDIFKTDNENYLKEQLDIVNLFNSGKKLYLSWSEKDAEDKVKPSIYIEKILAFDKYFDKENILKKYLEIKEIEKEKLYLKDNIKIIVDQYLKRLYELPQTKEAFLEYLQELKTTINDIKRELKIEEELYKIEKLEKKEQKQIEELQKGLLKLKEIYDLLIKNTEYLKIIEQADIKNLSPKLDKNVLSELYNNGVSTSISKLEEYAKCPFAYYLKYILKLKEANTIENNNMDTGIFIHEVIQNVLEDVKSGELKIDTITKNVDIITLEILILADAETEETKQEVEKYKKDVYENVEKNAKLLLQNREYEKMKATPKNIQITKKIISNIQKSAINILEFIRLSEFEVKENEKEFKKESSIYIESLGKEIPLRLIGRIDRMDILKNGNEFRIVDYKSSNKTIDKYKVMSGLQLQLFTYAEQIKEQENLKPTGLMYIPLMYSNRKVDTFLDVKERLKKEKSTLQFTGVISYDDDKELEKYDKTLSNEKEKSDIIKLNKSGDIKNSGLIGLKTDEYEELAKSSKEAINEISKKLLEGNTDILPYMYISGSIKENACTYCIYKNICKKQKENKFNFIINKDKLK